ncbi:MAG TPA: C25 family cysteine peptidase [Anaerolineae bacterium]|nr:C25 family cysteine peptidase [Anaerolineae bacterium]
MTQKQLILIPIAVSTALFVLFLGGYYWWTQSQTSATVAPPVPMILAEGEQAAAIRLTVTQTGLHLIPPDAFTQANFPPPTNHDQYQLLYNDQSIPYYLHQNEDGTHIYFYAQAITASAAPPAVYRLQPGPGYPLTTTQTDINSPRRTNFGRQTSLWEENTTFVAQARDGDTWLGPFLFAPSQYTTTLDTLPLTQGDAHLTVRLWSNNKANVNPDHHARLLVNDQLVGEGYWDGITSHIITGTIPNDLLNPPQDILTIDLPGDTGAAGEAIYLDSIQLNYDGQLALQDTQLTFTLPTTTTAAFTTPANTTSWLWNITHPYTPTIVTYDQDKNEFTTTPNQTYLLATPQQAHQPTFSLMPEWELNLRQPATGADYIIIVPPRQGFADALQPLITHRQQQGLSVLAVPLQQIYDEFGYGRQTPQAIRDFLAYTHAQWPTSPQYVLLAGDATYDPQSRTNGPNQDILPTYLIFTEYAGYVASDTWYTLFGDNELEPQLAIGRFPAQTVTQLETMVNKTIAYEQAAPNPNRNRALLVADNEPDFDEASDLLADQLIDTGYQPQKLYLSQNLTPQEEIINSINDGVGIINYIGHGGIQVWADEVVFRNEDVAKLNNGDQLPIFTTFTCLNGYFNHPEVNALAETLLWEEDGGIVAAIAPSGRSFTVQQVPIADVFYQQLLTGEATTLGQALQTAKQQSANRDTQREVIHTFNLLGDPALHFNP